MCVCLCVCMQCVCVCVWGVCVCVCVCGVRACLCLCLCLCVCACACACVCVEVVILIRYIGQWDDGQIWADRGLRVRLYKHTEFAAMSEHPFWWTGLKLNQINIWFISWYLINTNKQINKSEECIASSMLYLKVIACVCIIPKKSAKTTVNRCTWVLIQPNNCHHKSTIASLPREMFLYILW